MLLSRLISALVLFGACVFMYLFILQCRQVYGSSGLQVHRLALVSRQAGTETYKDYDDHTRQRDNLQLTFSDGKTYTAHQYISYISTEVNIGDTLLVYTKPITGKFGNFVTDEGGHSTFTTHNPNEIFQLVNCRNNDTIIDFNLQKQHLKSMLWTFPFCSLCFVGWFLYRISGRKSMFVMER